MHREEYSRNAFSIKSSRDILVLLSPFGIGSELKIDHQRILEIAQGHRSIDTLQLLDPSKANWEYVRHVESLIPRLYGSEVDAAPGARSVLDALDKVGAPWALVTSCTRVLLDRWIDLLSFPSPKVTVTAEDVALGKPEPACYLLGKERCGLTNPSSTLIIEDVPAGVKAGKAAGCAVLGVATTHDVEQLEGAGADWVVKDLESFRVVGKAEDGWELKLKL